MIVMRKGKQEAKEELRHGDYGYQQYVVQNYVVRQEYQYYVVYYVVLGSTHPNKSISTSIIMYLLNKQKNTPQKMHLLFIFNAKLTWTCTAPSDYPPSRAQCRWTSLDDESGGCAYENSKFPYIFPMSATTKLMPCKDLMRYSPVQDEQASYMHFILLQAAVDTWYSEAQLTKLPAS